MTKRAPKKLTGRQSIFRGKDKRERRQGLLTKPGAKKFEEARKRLAALAHRKTASDGDVMEATAMGWEAVAAYLGKPSDT